MLAEGVLYLGLERRLAATCRTAGFFGVPARSLARPYSRLMQGAGGVSMHRGGHVSQKASPRWRRRWQVWQQHAVAAPPGRDATKLSTAQTLLK